MNDLSDNFRNDAYLYLDNLKNSFNDAIIKKINLLCKDLYIAWENKNKFIFVVMVEAQLMQFISLMI